MEIPRQASLFVLLRLAFEELFGNGRIPPSPLLKALLSRGLGYCILLGSTVVKVPQLINVVRARSAAGLSSLSVELETLGYAISASYGLLKQLPFSAYGETMAMLLQNALLLVLIYHYQRKSAARTLCLLLALAGWAAALTAGALPFDKVALALSFNNLLFMASRVPQIVQSAQAGSTGQLSSITYTLNVAGAGARIFTSIHEKAGPAMLQGAILGTLLNAIVLAQILVYGRRAAKGKTE
ncbi:hypothetical protein ACKKBG_A32840 [Auxenochlorella protothecoides x Auxenochlorella symbiontica]|uniref:Mannose-P-dolichol utilization defect 1 protein homolog n=1 Tax=Auxenochlorella protothecoides TaxID=3075 RepID=A0A087SBA4_AUXPR|nr:Mannose-P-dolichol utilization defect 1 protein-like protein 1 [Auxenochlorella protothecoides]KFM23008.1 Mannose-P-dolichol utilization defect 1 protein-like protein 1 [Auxenochlorella protothecoides]RMZ57386.1 hypothetical protein APUTEX25_004220 [Auxenochlorella protothecoides]|eukprot:RMZ57386.1 hypothetical protein APUTEX25_004220 [Auxenochlorella protothecoides]